MRTHILTKHVLPPLNVCRIPYTSSNLKRTLGGYTYIWFILDIFELNMYKC